jgi:integrase
MKFNPSEPRPYSRRGVTYPGRWEIDLRGTLDNGFEVKRERRVFPAGASAGKIGKRQAAAMAFDEWQRWNRYGQVLRPGEKPSPSRGPATAPASTPTFAQFAPEFLEFCASPNASPRGANRPATLASKRYLLKDYLLPAFGSMPMDQLTSRDVDRFVIAQTKKLKPNSIAKATMVLHRMLVVAKRHGLINVLPEVRSPARPRGTVKALEPDEAARFLAVLPELYGDRRALMLELYLRTGMRRGEGLGLYPADFNLDATTPTLRIARSFTKFGYGPTKGGKARTVPLSRRLASSVDDYLAERGLSPKDTQHHVFCALGNPERPVDRSRVHHWAHAAGEAAKTRRVHPHMLRHTFGTECARRGVPVLTIKEWMGHASIDTTMVYVHLVAPDHLRWAGLLGD